MVHLIIAPIPYVGPPGELLVRTGEHKKSNGWNHTVAYYVSNTFIGCLRLQGTLEDNPTEEDWFFIDDTTFTIYNDKDEDIFMKSRIITRNFQGNFAKIRVHVSLEEGSVTKVLLG